MELASKVQYASAAIKSITRHDDAPLEEVEKAALALRDLIDAELVAAETRHAAKKTGGK